MLQLVDNREASAVYTFLTNHVNSGDVRDWWNHLTSRQEGILEGDFWQGNAVAAGPRRRGDWLGKHDRRGFARPTYKLRIG